VLLADEIQVVLKLAAPCDQLSKGSRTTSASCDANDECNTPGGYACIKKLGESDGTCQKPEEVAPGDPCDGPAQVCEDGYFCNGDNCVAYQATARACDADYQCAPDDLCVFEPDAEAGVCTARAELNDVCAADEDCQSRFCSFVPGETEGECASRVQLSRSEPLCDTLQ
jgi:hypothetical protein